MRSWFNIFPLIFIPVLIYNLVVVFATMAEGSSVAGADAVRSRMLDEALRVPMASGVYWYVYWGELLILFALTLLFVELLKSTSTGASAIFNHALSMIVFIVCLIEFLLFRAFATSTFFILMIMSLLDVLAGVIVTIVSARRDVEFDK